MTNSKKLDTQPGICQTRIIHKERIEQANKYALSDHEIDCLSKTFKVLGDPTRLKIVIALKNVEMCVCDIAAHLNISESAISHQLRRLKDLFIVKYRRDGQVYYYTLDDNHIAEILETGLKHIRE